MGTLKDDLIAIKALIDTPAKWRKDALVDDPASCCAVIAGRRYFVANDDSFDREDRYVQALLEAIPRDFAPSYRNSYLKVGEYNDHPSTTHDDVMALFDRAIAASE